ncbi:MAG: hypothetical protein Kow0098_14590 [Ignavibacteriaceae bacterium]
MFRTILMFVILNSVFLSGCNSEKPDEKIQSGPESLTLDRNTQDDKIKAAGFTLPGTDGKNYSLSDYVGKIIILDFWATWCGPCRRGIPDLIDIQNQYKDQVVVLGISLDQQNTVSDVIPFMQEFGINYPVLYGNAEVVKNYGNINAIPTSFIVDQKGFIVDKHVGLVPKSVYINKINSLLDDES